MPKKKTNPNRIPASWSEADTKTATKEITEEMILLAWALVLCTLGDRWGTTAEDLLDFWHTVNTSCSRLQSAEDIEDRLDELDRSTGIRFPFHRISTENIHSRAAVVRARRKLRENSLHAMFALIADTIVRKNVLDHESLCWLFKKVQGTSSDIDHGRLSSQDLMGVLEDEFSLRLCYRGEDAVLEPINSGAGQLTEK